MRTHFSLLDNIITHVDQAVRTLCTRPQPSRDNPGAVYADNHLGKKERQHAVRLMRINHSGEICAQALYQGQALASKNTPLKCALSQAAQEEIDHLAWTEERIHELGGRTSLLNPFWYLGALSIGVLAGKLGDEWNLGFLAETEHQVEKHLDGHLKKLSPEDQRSWAIVNQMKIDEGQHADLAKKLGARDLPFWTKKLMKCSAKIMTTTTFWL